MHIFSAEGKVTPAQDKTNIPLAFTVPEGVTKLIVEYQYTPKFVEDQHQAALAITNGLKKYNVDVINASSFLPVPNLVTLSFDENDKYRGACHRQPNEQVVTIANRDSTPGIHNRPVQPGSWQIVLNVHYAGCDINYSININGEVEQ